MKVTCLKCKKEMHRTTLDSYEYLESIPLFEAPAYRCPACRDLFFTEAMAEEMERRSLALKARLVGFQRRVSTSGGGIAVRIPSDLRTYLGWKPGQKVNITAAGKRGFVVEKA